VDEGLGDSWVSESWSSDWMSVGSGDWSVESWGSNDWSVISWGNNFSDWGSNDGLSDQRFFVDNSVESIDWI
jgi:hypothetical protein